MQYIAVAAPKGAEVEKLANPQEVHADGELFYLSNGVYYKKLVSDGKTRYVVVDAPVGYEVDALPEGAVKQSIEGKTYYQQGNVFYRPIAEGSSYVIVPAPY